ncbi:hypothetical protein Dimus_011217 [Dionaea muscipula]
MAVGWTLGVVCVGIGGIYVGHPVAFLVDVLWSVWKRWALHGNLGRSTCYAVVGRLMELEDTLQRIEEPCGSVSAAVEVSREWMGTVDGSLK